MKKIIFNIFLCLLIINTLTFCGKKGDLKQPENNKEYPRQYPNE